MNPISPLMQSVLAFDVMKDLSYANAIARSNDCGLIVLIIILSQWLLRPDEKWIRPFFQTLVRVAASCADLRDLL